MSIGTNIQTVNMKNTIQPKAYTAFKAQFAPAQNYLPDTVEINGKKKKNGVSTIVKASVGLGIIGTIAIAAGLIAKGKTSQAKELEKLYLDKMVQAKLSEHIDFKEAKTLQEAISFSKNVLKIKDVDSNFTLDALNIINKGIVDVSNAHKGRVYLPRSLEFADAGIKENWFATVNQSVKSDKFFRMKVNKNYYDDNILDKKIKSFLYRGQDKIFEINNSNIKSFYSAGSDWAMPTKELAKYIEKFYKNPASMSIKEKQILFNSMYQNDIYAHATMRNPIDTIKTLIEKHKNILKKENYKINIDELSKKSIQEQKDELWNIIRILDHNNIHSYFKFDVITPEYTIYHELGHLQDFGLNLKNLHVKLKKSEGYLIDNRWGTIEDKHIREYFEQHPDGAKKYYPDLYEFLNNSQIQITAGKVSDYSQVGIGEFIAEAYAEMISGKKLPDDVIALYKKYNGPLPKEFK